MSIKKIRNQIKSALRSMPVEEVMEAVREAYAANEDPQDVILFVFGLDELERRLCPELYTLFEEGL